MNYKLLFPTYRNRFLFVKSRLKTFGNRKLANVLNLGTGEGDYDHMISSSVEKLVSCDINPKDVNFAQQLNKDIVNIDYRVEDALNLSFKNDSFDLIISVDVMEHVGDPEQMIKEIGRVLKSNGLVFLTYPQLNYPFTYDPFNRLFSFFGVQRKIPFGAYAFGHEYLVDMLKVEEWAAENDMEVLQNFGLSGYLIGLLEMYWTGAIQYIFKSNSKNLNDGKIEDRKLAIRPSRKEPVLSAVTDLIIKLDRILFTGKTYSVGRGMVLRKK